jgi:hypothetical protein
MELLVILIALVALALAGRFAGADSRPCFDEPQQRKI